MLTDDRTDNNDIFDVPSLAAFLGVREETIYIYRARGYLPEEDVKLGNSPGWFRSTIVGWNEQRPGKGWRKGQRRDSEEEDTT